MILDSHIHVHSSDARPAEEIRRELKRSMAVSGVTGGVLLSSDPDEAGAPCAKDRLMNVMALCEGDEHLYPFYWVNPMNDNALEEVDAAVKAGIAGFKIICSGYYPSHDNCMEVYRRIAAHNKPLLFHSGILWDGKDSARYNRPGEFECMLDINNIKFALAHISWPWCDECLAVYGKFNNAYTVRPDLSCEMFIDITPGTPRNYREQAFSNMLLGDYTMKYNLLFGTDCSANGYSTSWTDEWLARDNSLYKKFVPDDTADFMEHVYSKNLLRFLGKNDEKIEKILPRVAV